jgi:hypothetical protein
MFMLSPNKPSIVHLGIPMHHRKGKHMSVGGHLVLINSVLTCLVMFMFSFFEVPREVFEKIDYYRSRFYWWSDQHKKKYRLMRWNIICQPKVQDGHGIINIDVQNRCLLSKWLFKLINEDEIWQTMLYQKILENQTIMHVQKKPGNSLLDWPHEG